MVAEEVILDVDLRVLAEEALDLALLEVAYPVRGVLDIERLRFWLGNLFFGLLDVCKQAIFEIEEVKDLDFYLGLLRLQQFVLFKAVFELLVERLQLGGLQLQLLFEVAVVDLDRMWSFEHSCMMLNGNRGLLCIDGARNRIDNIGERGVHRHCRVNSERDLAD